MDGRDNNVGQVEALAVALTGLTGVLQTFMEQQAVQHQPRNNTGPISDDQALERFLMFNPSEYFGEIDQPQLAEAWLDSMENIFAVLNYSSQIKVQYATFKLKGAARDWWAHCKNCWVRTNTEATWDNFIEAFQQRFLPPWVCEQKEDEFLQLKQGSMTVPQYEARFSKLSKFCQRLVDMEEHRIRKFVKGLRLELQTAMAASPPQSYALAVDIATRVEVSRRVEASARETARAAMLGKRLATFPRKKMLVKRVSQEASASTNTSPTCGYCGKKGHEEAICWGKKGACMRCGSIRHTIQSCPRGTQKQANPPSRKPIRKEAWEVNQNLKCQEKYMP